jgi:hypothetical protein
MYFCGELPKIIMKINHISLVKMRSTRLKAFFIIIMLMMASASMQAKNVAFLVGVGNYPVSSKWNTIHSAADISLLEPILKKRGFAVTKLVDGKATKSNIVKGLKHLIATSHVGDVIFIHFSCHGQQMADVNSDEPDGLDEAIIPYDAQMFYKKGVYTGGKHLSDDELNVYVNQLKKKLGSAGIIFISMDACHSGDAIRAEENDSIDADLLKYERGTSYVFSPNIHKVKNVPMNMIRRNKIINNGATLIAVGACSPNERNFEHIDRRNGVRHFNGSLSYCMSLLISKSANPLQWADYFKNKEYKGSGIFPLQNPYYERY